MEEKNIQESFQKIREQDGKFDIRFWQSHGEKVIFEAAMDMVKDYLILKNRDANELRLQRIIESFRPI